MGNEVPFQRPDSASVQEELLAGGDLTPAELTTAAWDVLYYVYVVAKAKGKLLVQFPGDHIPSPVKISIPGLLELKG